MEDIVVYLAWKIIKFREDSSVENILNLLVKRNQKRK